MLTEAIPDEPLGDHVLELQIAEVVAETDDARSLVFEVPGKAGVPADPGIRPRDCATHQGSF